MNLRIEHELIECDKTGALYVRYRAVLSGFRCCDGIKFPCFDCLVGQHSSDHVEAKRAARLEALRAIKDFYDREIA